MTKPEGGDAAHRSRAPVLKPDTKLTIGGRARSALAAAR